MSQNIFKNSNRRQANQKRPVFEVREIKTPDCVWSQHKNFKLANIPAIFEPTSYQRALNTPHTYRIVSAIVNNQFYDNTLRVVKIGKGKYSVIDGQHRLAALWILHTQYGVQTYDLAIQIFDKSIQREVFRRINAGKGLTHGDILKTYDTGNIKFFDDLKDYASHIRTTSSPSFITLFQAIWFARGNRRASKPLEFKEILDSITDDEVSCAARIAIASSATHTTVPTHKIFSSAALRIVMCIGVEKNYSVKEYQKALLFFVTNEHAAQVIMDAKHGHFDNSVKQMMKLLKDNRIV